VGRLIIVSNRLPVLITKEKGDLNFKPSVGGVAVGLSSVYKDKKSIWIGWPGLYLGRDKNKRKIVERELRKRSCYPVFLPQRDVENYYYGFSNKTIWPLFHYFTQFTIYEKEHWESYKRVNESFANQIIKLYKKDDTVWIHDYHLMLLPQLLRKKVPDMNIGIFIHIPFPSWELFRLLPWRKEILEGLLGSDLIGFHVYEYVLHFLGAVNRLLGFTHDFGKILMKDRIVRVDAFPMGIDYKKYNEASLRPRVQREIKKIKARAGEKKIILSIDRLDYTKGIPERLEAYNYFFEKYPEYRGRIILVLVAVPSRTRVEHYKQLKRKVDEYVGRINARYGTIDWTPVWYIYNTLPFDNLIALYYASDIALITPLRDGMNLIAKEYITAKKDESGVLILSEMAGASKVLTEAIIINPNNKDDIASAIKYALTMPEVEKLKRMKIMQERLVSYDIKWWVKEFIERLKEMSDMRKRIQEKRISNKVKKDIIKEYKRSHSRLFLFDYDGTLIDFFPTPQEAKPDRRILNILRRLASDERNEIVILSGRSKEDLEKWFDIKRINLVAEHGAYFKGKDYLWQLIEPLKSDWKKEILPVLKNYVTRTPGSFIEEKDYSLCWHYRNVPSEFGSDRAGELIASLTNLTANLDLQILKGNKVVEVRNIGVNKGRAALKWITERRRDFILSLGDDFTDEDIFKILPKNAVSMKVGEGPTFAKYTISSPQEVRKFLLELIK